MGLSGRLVIVYLCLCKLHTFRCQLEAINNAIDEETQRPMFNGEEMGSHWGPGGREGIGEVTLGVP